LKTSLASLGEKTIRETRTGGEEKHCPVWEGGGKGTVNERKDGSRFRLKARIKKVAKKGPPSSNKKGTKADKLREKRGDGSSARGLEADTKNHWK